jgi:hypothetical protein
VHTGIVPDVYVRREVRLGRRSGRRSLLRRGSKGELPALAKYSATEEGVHIEHPITWDYHENR